MRVRTGVRSATRYVFDRSIKGSRGLYCAVGDFIFPLLPWGEAVGMFRVKTCFLWENDM